MVNMRSNYLSTYIWYRIKWYYRTYQESDYIQQKVFELLTQLNNHYFNICGIKNIYIYEHVVNLQKLSIITFIGKPILANLMLQESTRYQLTGKSYHNHKFTNDIKCIQNTERNKM